MSIEPNFQFWNTIGTWFAGIGTFAAVAVALWLARRVEKVKLKCNVGLRLLVGTGVSQEILSFHVTNLGERPITVDSVGWRFGKGKKKRYLIQTLTGVSSYSLPKKLEHGEAASFMINFVETPNWMTDFCKSLSSRKDIDTLRAQIHTSVGHTENVKPDESFLDELRKMYGDSD